MASKSRKLALRYARALLRAADREDVIPTADAVMALREQVLSISNAWATSEEFRLSITNPMIPEASRQEMLDRAINIFQIPKLLAQFLRVVLSRGRAEVLPEISAAFSELADTRAGITRVEITTARGVAADEMQAIEGRLGSKIQGQLVFSWREDPAILGGIVVRFGGRVLDGSLKRRVSAIERQILG